MIMATVYLHIGLPKTGTTALQRFLYNNTDVLERHGVSYPDFGLRYKNNSSYLSFHKNVRFLIAPNTSSGTRDFSRPADEYAPTLDKIAELGKSYEKIIISDEGIWKISGNRENFWSDLKSDLKSRGLELKVIVYLRRQDSFVQSLYAQRVKETKQPFTFEEYLASEAAVWPLDFKKRLDHISGIVGKDAMLVRIYEKGQYQGREEEPTLFSDFLDIFGLALSDGFQVEQEQLNSSFDGTYLELKRLLNILPESINGSALQKTLYEIGSLNPYIQKSTKTTYFKSREVQQAFLDQFAESNSAVAREYLGRKDGQLFYERIPDLPQETVSTEELLRDSLLFYGRTIQRLEKQNAELEQKLEKLEAELEKKRSRNVVALVKNSVYSRTQKTS